MKIFDTLLVQARKTKNQLILTFPRVNPIRSLILIIFGCYSILSIFLPLPEMISAIMAMFFMILIPIILGRDLLTFGIKNKIENLVNLDVVSRLVIFWAMGSLFVFHLINFSWALGIQDLKIITFLVLILLLFGSFSTYTRRKIHLHKVFNKPSILSKAVIIGIIAIIGLSSVLFFRLHQPFPTYMTAEFAYFGKPIQLIDGLDEFRIAERACYAIFQASLTIGSFLFNVHPLAVIWIAALGQSIIIAGGIFLLARRLFNRLIPSLIAAFLAMWVFAGAAVQNNPYVVSNANVQYVFFILALYIITRSLQRNNALIQKRSLPVILGIPALLVIQRLAVGYDSLIWTLLISVLPFVLLMFFRKSLLTNDRYQFSLILLMLFTIIAMLHPFMAPVLYIFTLLVYIGLWKYRMSGRRFGISMPIIIVSGALLFYMLQFSGLLLFQDNFVLSRHLFGNLYDGILGVDVGFSDKMMYFARGNANLVIVFFLIGSLLMILNSSCKSKSDIIIVSASAVSFLIYLFPEGWFARARFMIPFFVLVIAGAANIMIPLLDHSLKKIRNFTIHSSTHVKFSTSILILLIFAPVLYDSSTPFREQLTPWIESNSPYATFEQYEYEAGKWLRQNISLHERRNTLILSDPFTINLMTSLTGLKPPYKRQWIEAREYSDDDLQIMEGIRTTLLKSKNINDRIVFLRTLFEKTNTSSAIIIINGRTMQWLSAERIFVATYFGITRDVDQDFIQRFSLVFSTTPIYYVTNKLYLYRINIDDMPDFLTGLIQVIADDDSAQSRMWTMEVGGEGTIGRPTLSDDITLKVVGNDSLKMEPTAGNKSIWWIVYNYMAKGVGSQDWSEMDYLAFYWHGTNSNKLIRITLGSVADSWENCYWYDIMENWEGWKLIVLYLRDATDYRGMPDLSQVTRISFSMRDNVDDDRWIDYIIIGSLES